jgi:SAM-dependent methyltransferase
LDHPDKSNGYERIAHIFISSRGQNHAGVGARAVAEWSRMLQAGATILDLGCGPGVPIAETLIKSGFKVYGSDASPGMVSAFRNRFPGTPVQCAAVEESDLFGRSFEGVVAWGLLFLLEAETQRRVIAKIAAVLPKGGRFLFMAPSEACWWPDAMTGQQLP